jgi:hypothetical protein
LQDRARSRRNQATLLPAPPATAEARAVRHRRETPCFSSCLATSEKTDDLPRQARDKKMICQDRLGTKRKESLPKMAFFHADFRLQRTSILGSNFYVRKNHIAASGIRTLSGPQPRQLLYEEPLGARKRHAVLPTCLVFVLSLSRQIDRFLSFSDVCPEPVSANHITTWID